MAIPLTVNGVVFSYPEEGDVGYAGQATAWAEAITDGTIQLGGTYDLDSELIFTSFGITAPHFKSGTTNAAAAGVVRLAKTDSVSWRNNANGADVALSITTGNALTFDGNLVTGQPCVIASTTTATSCTGSATVVIPYATETVDTDNAFNGATGTFTVPAGKGGHYQVNAGVRLTVVAGAACDLELDVQVNGVAVLANGKGPWTTTVTEVRAPYLCSGILNLAAGDTVRAAVVNGVGTARSLDTSAIHNFFSIQKVS